MNDLPDGTRGKILAVGILLGAIILFYMVLVAPLIGLYDSGAEALQDRADLAQRLQNATRELPRLRQAAEDLKAGAADEQLLLEGDSDTVAAATLQTTVKTLIEDGGARLDSAEILPPEKRDPYQKVGLRVSFTGDLTLLTAVLRGIETARPVIFVDNVDIRGEGGAGQDDGGQALTIAFDLYGFRPL
jgi:general secretion pathway protein M